jgi:predicted  nucleic acid-binding Zn-ribbon protein
LAAQERRVQEVRQGAAIQRQMNVFSRERETLAAELTNEKSKNSILEQEIFMVKDAFQKYKGKADAERHEHLQEITGLRANCNGLELLVKDLSVKASLLPMYEQRINEG